MNCFIKYRLLPLILLCINLYVHAQVKTRQTEAIRTDTPPKINGIIDDAAWSNIPVASNFIQYEPVNGMPSKFKTEVKVIYDDAAIYINAMMYDSNPDSIPCELGKRDNSDLNADYFSINLNPFNDGQNALIFSVSSSGIQYDAKVNGENADEQWDAVWQSTVKINNNGWSVEIKIPWSAIRFPKTFEKPWGINFWRYVRRARESSSWNLVDNSNAEMANQMGELNGINNIKAPLRLSFSPYVSFYIDHYPYNIAEIKNTSTIFNGGMDMKFGLTESFTLDMTLIPDFGQVQSDNVELNLTPFEIKYDEKRPFFTEGTELFSRADLFYSRRIGNTPVDFDKVYNKLSPGDIIASNPTETQLLNATKISGRTSKDLGLGFFNAITSNTYATIKDSLGNKRKILTQPLTNYNIVVVDQPFMKNSYVSIINTNAYYDKGGKMANVTGTEFKLANKKNKFAILGNAAVSQKFDTTNSSPVIGHRYQIACGKISGKFKYAYIFSHLSDKFNPNDLGFLEYNNEILNEVQLAYNFYDPFWKFINMMNSLDIRHKNLYNPRDFTSLEFSLNNHATLKNYFTYDINLYLSPGETKDYYEPRKPGRFLIRSPNWYMDTWYSTDYRKSFAIDCGFGYLKALGDWYKDSFWWWLQPRMRINDRFTISHQFMLDHEWHDYGYATFSNSDIIIGMRNVRRVENIFNAQYIFRQNISLSFRCRHYWSTVKYKNFYYLGNDGNPTGNANPGNLDESFNAFNIDMFFTWRFAPGSQIDIVWKNEIYNDDNLTTIPFYEDFDNTMNTPQLNSISVKFLYYFDWAYLHKKSK